MSRVTTHVLDTSRGRPAAGIEVTLTDRAGRELARASTDEDGRIGSFSEGGGGLPPGIYTLRFATGDYLAQHGAGAASEVFYPLITITFAVARDEHYHVPLLLSPFGYTTYRGS